MEPNRKDTPVAGNPIWNLASLGAEFTGILIIHAFFFSWLDEKWGTTPWLLMAGMTLGFSAGIYHLIQRTKTPKG